MKAPAADPPTIGGALVGHKWAGIDIYRKRGTMRRKSGCAGAARWRWTAGAALLAVTIAAPSAAAQSTTGEGRACFEPRPMPLCRSFWVTEFGLQYFVSEPPGRIEDQRRVLVTWELGWMQNRSPSDAIGGSVFLATNDNTHRSGVRARYRRWTGGGTALDISPALIIFEADEDMDVHATLGAALQASVSWRDWIGVSSQLEAIGSGVRLQAGFRLGGYPGAATGVALPLAALYAARHDKS
jgi:hypothetical protein